MSKKLIDKVFEILELGLILQFVIYATYFTILMYYNFKVGTYHTDYIVSQVTAYSEAIVISSVFILAVTVVKIVVAVLEQRVLDKLDDE